VNLKRVAALVSKEFLELRRNRAAFVPMVLTMVATLAMPFTIVIGIPALTGERLSDSEDFTEATQLTAKYLTGLAALGPEASIQAFLFQQFLIFLMLVPVTGALSLAAYSVIGEKQARSLEPLLATPLSTAELLGAKVISATAPAVMVEAIAFTAYLVGIAWLGEPGVVGVLLSARTLVLMGILAPLASHVAMQLAVLTSSRVNDPRSAQQVGDLIITPIVVVMGAQFSGLFFLTASMMAVMAGALFTVWLLLFGASILLFDREAILTRWK
jgi:ABC-2 type transport system permease protein